MTALIFLAACFLAYSNGANDNFKGVASLFGSGTTNYRTAIAWATLTTGAGSVAAIFLGQSLARKFSGKGLVPDALTTQPEFLLAVALAAGATVMLATLLGFPVSTTHGLTGALIGAGIVTGVGNVNLVALGRDFVSPLLLAPLIAAAASAALYSILRALRVRQPAICQQRYSGTFLGVSTDRLVDALHFLSAGAVSFARGLNDTPKIAALLLAATAFSLPWGQVAVSIAMAVGGLISAARVADTMAHKITDMNPGQGLAANLATALLVNTASLHGLPVSTTHVSVGLPVSTTHVSVGSLFGIGIVTRQGKWKSAPGVVLSWIVTLPCGAGFAALTYLILRPH